MQTQQQFPNTLNITNKSELITDLRILLEKANLEELETEVKERIIQNFFKTCDIIEEVEKNL